MAKLSTKVNRYYISFIEECIQHPSYLDYIAGRIEVFESDAQYDCKEIRFFTKDVKKFRAFRDRWDMKDITEKQLQRIEEKVGQEFNKFPDK